MKYKRVAFSQELRKEVVELRRSLQQSQAESQFLHEELRKSGGQSATPANFMEDKIQLLKEARLIRLLTNFNTKRCWSNNISYFHPQVERLKSSLCEANQARVKLLERAKRHVSPDAVHYLPQRNTCK